MLEITERRFIRMNSQGLCNGDVARMGTGFCFYFGPLFYTIGLVKEPLLLSAFRSRVLPIVAGLLLFAMSTSAQVIVSGTLTENTTFSKANNPYIVIQDLIVPKGITLTIEPGTLIKFSTDTRLVVRGDLHATGTAADSIYFVNVQNPNPAIWRGIVFDSAQTVFDEFGNYISGTILSHASIFHSSYSVTVSGDAGILIENSLIRKSDYGFYMNSAKGTVVRNCRISETSLGVFFPSGFPASGNIFENNVISDNYLIGVTIGNCNGTVRNNLFKGNTLKRNYIGFYIGNDGNPDPGHNQLLHNHVVNNVFEGARIYQDSTILKGNYFIGNAVGVNLYHSTQTDIIENYFSGNTQWAIQLTDSSTGNRINGNSILRNNGGVRISPAGNYTDVANEFQHNSLYNNNGKSFQIEVALSEGIHNNTFLNNGDTNSFVNRSPVLIYAENNYWGTLQTATIDSMIFDKLDDASFGMVQYMNPLPEPDTASPILPPRNVVKKQVGNDVLVSWDPADAGDLRGYYVYSGSFDGFSYASKMDAGNVSSFTLPSHSVFDTIAVSAYDNMADGQFDQVEGHESEYILAQLSPYAGPDTAICINSSVLLDKATAFNYEIISWTTAGDGSFNGSHILKPRYYPGPLDYANGEVELTITVSGTGFQISDRTKIYFSQPPYAFAGSDTAIFNDEILETSSAIVGTGQEMHWQSLGDGQFTDADSVITFYTPGTLDLQNSYFRLVLSASSPCGTMTDTIEISLIKGFSIHGRVLAGEALASGSGIHVFRETDGVYETERAAFVTNDGEFTLSHLVEGDYYLYAVPDKLQFSSFAPSYYFNRIHWEDAYRIPISEETFDLDVQLVAIHSILPTGEGFIGGSCVGGATGQVCNDIAVLLYDQSGKYLLGWTMVNPDGSFELSGLPYGEYLLIGEKIGYARFFSEKIELSPVHPAVSNAQLRIEGYKISVYIPDDSEEVKPQIEVYPNPCHDGFLIDKLPHSGLYTVMLTMSDGKSFETKVQKINGEIPYMNISSYPSGIYGVRVYSGQFLISTFHIIKY